MEATQGTVTACGESTDSTEPVADSKESVGRLRQLWSTQEPGPLAGGAVSVGELGVFAAAILVALVAMVGLASAHLHHYSLTAVGLGTAAALGILAVVLRVSGRLPKVVLDLKGLLILVATAVVAAVMFLPGFHYGAGDRDPGGYMMIGATIAREGSTTFTDPVLASPDLPVQVQSPGARFAGIWITDADKGTVTPQFYHLWPALLATADKLHGFAGMANTDPLVAILAVLLAVAVARRLGGLVAAGVTGLLLSTHMMQVWQAKYPSAEVFSQMLFMAAVLGLVLAFQTKWRWPAFVAGVMLGAGWLARADGVLLVLLAIGIGATLWVLRRFDARGWWFAAGLTAVSLHALYQAYGPSKTYTLDNKVPKLTVVLALVAVMVVGALVLRPVLGRLAGAVVRVGGSGRWQRRIGIGLVAVCVGLFGLALVRPMFGEDIVLYLGRPIRSYDERSIYWLSWFFTWPGLVLIVGGIAFVAVRRWQSALWVIVIPTLALLPLYMWHARNSAYLMWWGRRYVSTLLPGMVILIALGIAGLWAMRGRIKLPARGVAVLVTAFLGVSYLHQSLPVRQHDEWGGTYFIARDLAALPGDGQQGVFLWEPAPYCCAASQSLLAGPLWLEHNQISVLLPRTPQAVPGYVANYVEHFSDRPVYVLSEKSTPPELAGFRVTTVREYAGTFPRWEESSVKRPDRAIAIPYHFYVYQVEAAA